MFDMGIEGDCISERHGVKRTGDKYRAKSEEITLPNRPTLAIIADLHYHGVKQKNDDFPNLYLRGEHPNGFCIAWIAPENDAGRAPLVYELDEAEKHAPPPLFVGDYGYCLLIPTREEKIRPFCAEIPHSVFQLIPETGILATLFSNIIN